jgi:hypothetical protein
MARISALAFAPATQKSAVALRERFNSEATDTLVRFLNRTVSAARGDLADASGLTYQSLVNQTSQRQRMSADVLRSLLCFVPPAHLNEAARALTAWMSPAPLHVAPLPTLATLLNSFHTAAVPLLERRAGAAALPWNVERRQA